jgi:putative FmdB family regulatory protein
MPVYQFVCKKHGAFEKITIKAEWDDIKCPKCGMKSKVDEKCNLAPKSILKNI